MKILWLSHLIPYPPKGGVLQRSYNLIKELSKYHELDLLAFNQRFLIKSFFNSVEEGITEARSVLNQICRRIAFFDIPADHTTWGSYSLAAKSILSEPYNINWLKSKEFSSKLVDWLSQESYDWVHFDTISLIPYYRFISGTVQTCLDHHNIESHMLLRRAEKEENPLKKIYFWQEGKRLSRYEQLFCQKFSMNITCSELDTKRLLEIAPSANVFTVPNGVDLEYFMPQSLSKCASRLIFVGTMNWYPNIDAVLFLAGIWSKLKKIHPVLECDIVGANPPASVRALSRQLPDFHVHGFIDDVRPQIETATVYVCPIRDGGGTKLKLLDAMAMEKAIVAHPVACEGINIKDEHNVLLATDEADFIKNITLLLESPKMREDLGKSARYLVTRHYGYQAIGKQLSDAFERGVK